MADSTLLTLFLPIALAILMAGLGLHLTRADFARVLRQPRAVLVALMVQALALPPVAFALAWSLKLPPELAVGLVLLSASPGGVTANIFSHLARGDVALNVTLTAVNSALALVTLPLWTGLALQFFLDSENAVPPPLRKLIEVAVIVVVHADPWWNAAAQNQATDRAHRIGQTQDVNVYQIVAKDTIEERILKLQEKKNELARQFTDGTASGGVGTLSKDDLLGLLS